MLRVFLGSPGGDWGKTAAASEGPWSCPPSLQGLSQSRACTHKSRLLRQSLAAANDVCGLRVQAVFCRRRHQPRRPPPAKIRPGRPAAKAWENENRPQLSLTGPRLAQLLQVLIGLLRPQRVERLRPLRGLRAWLDRNAWSVVAASVHSRASLRYSSRRRGSTVNSAARTQFSAWYS